jgi:hypothetical protein
MSNETAWQIFYTALVPTMLLCFFAPVVDHFWCETRAHQAVLIRAMIGAAAICCIAFMGIIWT